MNMTAMTAVIHMSWQRMAAERQAMEEIAGLDEHGGHVQGQ